MSAGNDHPKVTLPRDRQLCPAISGSNVSLWIWRLRSQIQDSLACFDYYCPRSLTAYRELPLMLPRKPSRIELKPEDRQEENFFFDGDASQLNSQRVVLRVRFYDVDKKAVVTIKQETVLPPPPPLRLLLQLLLHGKPRTT
eukprot:gene4779-34537_t